MEQFLTQLLQQAPNIGVALLMLYWQRKTIDQLLENQTKLIDRLLTYVDRDKQTVQKVLTANADGNGVPH